MALFDLPALLRRLPRRRGGFLRVHVVEPDGAPYSERVVAEPAGALVAVQRRYATHPRSGTRVGITRSALLAARWRGAAESAEAAWRELRLAAGLDGGGDASAPGMVFSTGDSADATRCAAQLLARWRDVAASCPGVRCLGPGVWVHEAAAIEPGARIVGPVWIGAGAFVAAGPPVVGPLIIADQTPPPPVPPPPPPWPAALPPVRCAWRPPAAPEPAPRRAGTRLFDVALSVVALVLAAPLFPLIMLAIWLEDGRPFFFAHVRQTRGGENFVCYKFRTMCRDAEKLGRHLAPNNLCDGSQFHIDADPRLLRVGRVLRHFHVYELPQFLNVFLGQMAVIGPRPCPEDEDRSCPAWRDARLSVKPGLTGLWQVSRTRAPQTDLQEFTPTQRS